MDTISDKPILLVLGRCVDVGIQHIFLFMPIFREAICEPLILRVGGSDLNQIWRYRISLALPSGFRILYSLLCFETIQCLKGKKVAKFGEIFDLCKN